ncbi:MAG: sugar kinase [Sneathiella sp.]
MPSKILAIGEIMLEMADVGGGLFKRSFAGDTFNVAHYLNAVTSGRLTADYLTALGEDEQSRECLAFMEAHGVSTARCLIDPTRTVGLFILSNDDKGEKQYGYWRGQSAARHVFDQPRDLSGYDLVYFSGITAAITAGKDNFLHSLRGVKQAGGRIAYDYNHRVKLWSQNDALLFAEKITPIADLIKISDEELELLYPDRGMSDLSNAAPEANWVLTCGGEKGEVWRGGTLIAHQEFDAVETVIDSSAAGDSFIASYIAAEILGQDVQAGLQLGHKVASQVVLGKGSIVPIKMEKLG